jgi:malonate transporter and related proteins
MVLHYAVPLALFAGTVTTSRAALIQGIPLVIALGVAIVGLYGVVLLSCHTAFRLPMSISALAALTAAAPAVPFVGPAVLGDLFGGLSAIPVAIGSLIINLTVVPVTVLFLALDRAQGDARERSPAAYDEEHSKSPSGPRLSIFTTKLAETVKEPIVWAPVLAFVFVLSGLCIPELIVHPLFLLGHASGGVALFACGIVLASSKIKFNGYVLFFLFLKNIMQPALVLGGLRWLGYGNPIVSEAVLTTSIPAMPIVIMLALQYRIAEAEAASAVFLSVMGSVVTMGVFIALTR